MDDDRNFDIFWINSEIQVAYGMSSSTINSGEMTMIEYLLFVTEVFAALIGNKCPSAKIALGCIVELIALKLIEIRYWKRLFIDVSNLNRI